MFGATVYLAQYFQLARGKSPTESGLLTIPLITGLLIASTLIGQVITRTGIWKRYVVIGSVMLAVGLALIGTVRADTPYIDLAVFMALTGAGIGMVMQNLVLAVQNVLPVRMIGTGSASIAFFRSLGGAIGVSALGALLSHRIVTYIDGGLTAIGVAPTGDSDQIPDLSELPGPVRHVVESGYGHGVADLFLAASPLALLTVVAVIALPNARLGTKSGIEQQLAEEAGGAVGLDVVTVHDAEPEPAT
jgi:MFS family permease